MARLKPYKNWTNQEIRGRLAKEIESLNTSEVAKSKIRVLVDMSLRDKVWNPSEDFDGCTVVQDTTHPDVACYLHDWLFISKYFDIANELFKLIMEMQPMTKRKCKIRYWAVKIATVYFKFTKKKYSSFQKSEIKEIIKSIKFHN